MPADDPGGEEFLAEFLDDYFAESDEHLTAVRRILLELEPEAGAAEISPAMVEELFRSFHSLKGLAGMVHLRAAELVSHHLESYLRRLRDADAVLTSAGVDGLIAGTDLLEQVIAARRLGQEPPAIDHVTGQLAALVEARPAGGACRALGGTFRRRRRRRRSVDGAVHTHAGAGGARRHGGPRQDAPARA